MLQWTLNSNLDVGSNEVRRSDIHMWVDPGVDAVFDALLDWESKGFIVVVNDPRRAKEKDVCLKVVKRIEAIPEPEDLNAESS